MMYAAKYRMPDEIASAQLAVDTKVE